jgi:hypothetical protein
MRSDDIGDAGGAGGAGGTGGAVARSTGAPPRPAPLTYAKPRLERFGTFRELTAQSGDLDPFCEALGLGPMVYPDDVEQSPFGRNS